MEKFKFSIDTKSLFYGLTNDIGGGHTATVATNLKQGNNFKPEYEYFLLLNNVIEIECNDELVNICASKSKSIVKINKVFYFKEIYVNGIKIYTEHEFGMYLKEEINPEAIQFGRIKLHYPITFKYYDYSHSIDNREVINAIKQKIGNYAFIVNYFVFYINTARLDIDLTIIGEDAMPYSKVFLDQKGVGNKFNKLFTENSDSYDYEIVALKRYVDKEMGPQEYLNFLPQLESKSINLLKKELTKNGVHDINIVIDKYPYSPVNIEYYLNNFKCYIILKSTATNIDYFFLSKHEWNLLSNNINNCKVCLIKKICSEMPIIEFFDFKQIGELKKEFMSMRISK